MSVWLVIFHRWNNVYYTVKVVSSTSTLELHTRDLNTLLGRLFIMYMQTEDRVIQNSKYITLQQQTCTLGGNEAVLKTTSSL